MKNISYLITLFVLCMTGAVAAESFDWPQWRGPDRNAISKQKGLLQSTGKLIWKSELPDGAENASGGNRADLGTGRRGDAGADRAEDRGQEDREEINARQGPQPVTVISAGSSWKYLDTGAYPGPDWITLKFTDDAWREGPAQLGYGDGDEKTRLNDAPDKYPRSASCRSYSARRRGIPNLQWHEFAGNPDSSTEAIKGEPLSLVLWKLNRGEDELWQRRELRTEPSGVETAPMKQPTWTTAWERLRDDWLTRLVEPALYDVI